MRKKVVEFDVVIIGGGMSGVCAALASARNGAQTALVHNRPVLGGNASSEIRMHIGGADFHASRPNARETGILEEILLDNKYKNPQQSYSEFDRVIWEKVRFQEGLELFLNTHISHISYRCGVGTDNKIEIDAVKGIQSTTEQEVELRGRMFIDTTGDAFIAYNAEADCVTGREGKDVYGEPHAPERSDDIAMGSTLLFSSKDMGKPVAFRAPDWANTYTKEDLHLREHGAYGHNYWWIELGGHELDTISDGETIKDELLKAVYGVWDHIKNDGEHGADNYALDWIGFLPGKRASRRVLGDYVLKEQDLLNTKHFHDTVAYGGWPMDMHTPGGLHSKKEPNEFIHLPDVYGIPYRSLYSRRHTNLLIGGRIISASHMAFGSARLMATCSVIGQAIGTAAALSTKHGCTVTELNNHINELQNMLISDDAYLPGIVLNDEQNLAPLAILSASSSREGAGVENITSGLTRPIDNSYNGWCSLGLDDEWIKLSWTEKVNINKIQLLWDSNLSGQIMQTIFENGKKDYIDGIPSELVREYELELRLEENIVHTLKIEDNYLRNNVLRFDKEYAIDSMVIRPKRTHGIDHYRLFEIRVY